MQAERFFPLLDPYICLQFSNSFGNFDFIPQLERLNQVSGTQFLHLPRVIVRYVHKKKTNAIPPSVGRVSVPVALCSVGCRQDSFNFQFFLKIVGMLYLPSEGHTTMHKISPEITLKIVLLSLKI